MELQERLAEYQQPWKAVCAVATCRDSPGFIDLWLPPFNFDKELRRPAEYRNPGVISPMTSFYPTNKEVSPDGRRLQ